MRVLLAAVVVLAAVLSLGACTTEEEGEDTTATGTRAATAAATKTATATPAGAAASATPRRDLVRRPNIPTRTPTPAATSVQTVVVTPPPVETAAPPPPPVETAAPPVVVTVAPTPVPVETPTPATPSWETSTPLEPVTPGTMVEVSIRNANGAPGETYPVGMLVRLPDQTDVIQEGTVSGSDWLTFYVGDTMQPGWYDVYFGLPQSDLIYAQDFFQVAGSSLNDPTTLSWQTSAPRTAVAMGDPVDLGLRNEYGLSGECYDFVVEVYDPDGYGSSGSGTVCADQWTYMTYSDTWVSGYYDVSYYIGDQFIASDYFEVAY